MSNGTTNLAQEKEKELHKSITAKLLSESASHIPIVGSILSGVTKLFRDHKNQQLLDFLIGLGICIQGDDMLENSLDRFNEKLNNADSYTCLSSIIDSVLFSKSRRSRLILGIITAKYINDDTIPYEDIIIVNALKDLLDEELNCFNDIYNDAITSGREEHNGKGAFHIYYDADQTLINTTFSKLIGLNIIGNKAQSITSKSPGSWHGNITAITRKFKEYIDLLNRNQSV